MVKAMTHTSQRPKWPELIPVSLAWSMTRMTRSIATRGVRRLEVFVKRELWRRVWPSGWHLEVRGSSLARRVVSLDKELYSTLSLFTQVYNWVPVTYCWGVTLRWTSIPSRWGVAILLGLLHATETGTKFRPCWPLAQCAFSDSTDSQPLTSWLNWPIRSITRV